MKINIFKYITLILLTAFLIIDSIFLVAAPKNDPGVINKNNQIPKNIILMISDGCGSNQILATDYYTYGMAGTQIYEQFPVRLHMSTYSLGQITKDDDLSGIYKPAYMWRSFKWMNKNATDSSAAATAMATGKKTYDAAIGVDEDGRNLKTITEEFEDLGKATGVVSSVPFSHATPASFAAHNKNRKNFRRIAVEMIRDSAIDLIMGGGNPLYDKNGKEIPNAEDQDYRYVGGKVIWDELLTGVIGADADKDGVKDPWILIQTKEDFERLQTGAAPRRLIGIPQVYETLQQGRSGNTTAAAFETDFIKNVPTLEVMSNVALNVLDANKDGFFLLIEGGAVDWANHANQSGRMIEEETDFNNTVSAVCRWVEENGGWDQTLVIVTADHESGCLSGETDAFSKVLNNGKGNMPVMVWNSSFHTNQLVPFFAKGSGADLFASCADQTDPVMGPYLDNTEIAKVIRTLER